MIDPENQERIADLMQEAFGLGIMPEVKIDNGNLSWDCTKLGQYILAHRQPSEVDPTLMVGDGDDE